VKLNVQYILGLQDYVNKKKRNIEFCPKQKLLI
jgi:hypothetical protein